MSAQSARSPYYFEWKKESLEQFIQAQASWQKKNNFMKKINTIDANRESLLVAKSWRKITFNKYFFWDNFCFVRLDRRMTGIYEENQRFCEPQANDDFCWEMYVAVLRCATMRWVICFRSLNSCALLTGRIHHITSIIAWLSLIEAIQFTRSEIHSR